MITPILEKLLINGSAKNKTFSMAYGTHAHLDIPENSFIVIHKIIFYPFINPHIFDPREETKFPTETWKQFFNSCEYQLKIQSDKENPFFYQFRNGIDITFLKSNFEANLPMTQDDFNKHTILTPKAPIILDTFVTSYDYFNFTLTRNVLKLTGTNYNSVNEYAVEDIPPTGIATQGVLLYGNLTGTTTSETYNPATPKEVTGYALPNNNTINYQQLYDPQTPGNYGSFIADPTFLMLEESDKTTFPLITFEYCQIQLNKAGNLSSL